MDAETDGRGRGSRRTNEFLRGPKWRTRTTSGRRHTAAAVTFAIVLATGVAVMALVIWLLSVLGAPGWVAVAPWWIPTAGTLIWTLVRPRIAELTDDDDDSWFGYSIRWALVGEAEARPAPIRVIGAAVLGAPVVWAVAVFGVLTVIGLV